MKQLILIAATFVAGLAHAGTIISERTVQVPVDISKAKVVKTNAGYGTTYLVKILVPDLAAPTLMNHRNAGESAPCLATYETNGIDDVVQGRPEVIMADMKITLSKAAVVDAKENLCHVFLTETVTTTIRGYAFVHTRQQPMPDRDVEDCQ